MIITIIILLSVITLLLLSCAVDLNYIHYHQKRIDRMTCANLISKDAQWGYHIPEIDNLLNEENINIKYWKEDK